MKSNYYFYYCHHYNYNYYNFEGELIQIYTKRSNSFFTETRFEKRDINPNAIFLDFEQRLLGNYLPAAPKQSLTTIIDRKVNATIERL